MHTDDEPEQPRPRWIRYAIVIGVIVMVSGVLNVGWQTFRARETPKPAQTNVPEKAPSNTPINKDAAATLTEGRTKVEGSDCLRCHGVDRRYVGPAFNQVAARYQGRPDAVDYLAGKIRNGGAGEWGRALMPRHPHLSEEQATQMAQWVLSLPPAAQ